MASYVTLADELYISRYIIRVKLSHLFLFRHKVVGLLSFYGADCFKQYTISFEFERSTSITALFAGLGDIVAPFGRSVITWQLF